KNHHDCTIVHGCSLGAFQAASLFFRHPRQHFVQDIIIKGAMPADALGRVTVKAVKGFCRQALDEIELEMAGFQLVGETRDE
ncbi:hypothetical protein ACC754_41840, partial [Rhizobium johnstonii]